MTNLRKYLRPIPAVMALAFVLLAIKGAGLALEARAQDGQSTAPVADTAKPAIVAADPAADDAKETSAGEVDVLTSLSKRRSELDGREQALGFRENLIAAAAKRVDDKIAELKQLQSQLQTLLGQRDAAEQKQLDVLVKSYSSMKPRDAARIFESLDDDVLLAVSSAMKSDVLGAVLAQMKPESAEKLTVKLANRLKVKDPQPPAPAQIAALTPPTTTPASASADAAAQATASPATVATAPANPPAATPPSSAASSAPAPANAASAPAK